MINLLKADFYRLKKDKVALIGLIIALGLTIFALVMTFLLDKLIVSFEGFEEITTIWTVPTGKTLLKGSFQVGQNAGLVTLIIIAILATKDFTNNTVRQKVIYGYQRYKIFLSQLITLLVYGFVVTFLCALINVGLGSIMFGYSSQGFKAFDILYFIYSCGFGLMLYAVYISFILAMAFITKSVGATIGISIGLVLVPSILFMILAGAQAAFDPNTTIYLVFKVIVSLFPDQHFNWFVTFNWLNLEEYLFSIISSLIYIGVNIVTGILFFKRLDIK